VPTNPILVSPTFTGITARANYYCFSYLMQMPTYTYEYDFNDAADEMFEAMC